MRDGTLRRWLLPLSAAVVMLAVPAGAGDVAPKDCDKRNNDTPKKLVECIQTDDLWAHMVNLEQIANANPGPDGKPSRNSGEPGYKASADYVANLMKQAGYDVTIQEYPFEYFAYPGVPAFSNTTTGQSFKIVDEWNPGASHGTANAPVEAAGSINDPSTGGSHSGCDPSDFNGFTAGNIALIQRGTCNFGAKVKNATAAGASGVIIFNEGNTPARSGIFAGSMVDAAGNPFVASIPVAFVPTATGFD